MIRWEACKHEFAEFIPRSSLRDIYVLSTTLDDWERLYARLRTSFKLVYEVDCNDTPLPLTAAEIFATIETASPRLSFLLGGTWVVTHFFTPDEIEFDIAARDITSQATLDQLLGFLQFVGDTVGKSVILTHENDEQHPFISYDPSRKEFEYHTAAA